MSLLLLSLQIIVTPLRVMAWVLLLLPLPTLKLSASKDASRLPAGSSSSARSGRSSRTLVVWHAPIVCYRQRPLLRHLLVIMFRLVPAIAASSSVGRVSPRYFSQSCLSFYPTLGLYLYVGWTAWVLLVSEVAGQGCRGARQRALAEQ